MDKRELAIVRHQPAQPLKNIPRVWHAPCVHLQQLVEQEQGHEHYPSGGDVVSWMAAGQVSRPTSAQAALSAAHP